MRVAERSCIIFGERGEGLVYLDTFRLPGLDARERFVNNIKRTCYTTVYPFDLFALREMPAFRFEPITIFYGGNGSGKSTLLNVIAERIGIAHGTVYNRSSFFEEYVQLCDFDLRGNRRAVLDGKIITSDDVFDYLLNIRCLNENIDNKREDLLEEYRQTRKEGYTFKSMADYEDLKRFTDAWRQTKSGYVRKRLMNNAPEKSNGESALMYFTENIQENAVYLLDEPENSLSAEKQLELKQFLLDSARFYGCQFIIASHSPFILSVPGAKIYDLDSEPIQTKRWTELENVRTYFDFFMEHRNDF